MSALFGSSSGLHRNKKVELILAALMSLLIIGFIIRAMITAPDVSGVYRNECCGDIIIRQGHFIYRGKSSNFRIVTQKLGLSGEVDGRFTREGVQVSEEPTPIGFSNEGGRRSLSIRIGQHDYTFILIQPIADAH